MNDGDVERHAFDAVLVERVRRDLHRDTPHPGVDQISKEALQLDGPGVVRPSPPSKRRSFAPNQDAQGPDRRARLVGVVEEMAEQVDRRCLPIGAGYSDQLQMSRGPPVGGRRRDRGRPSGVRYDQRREGRPRGVLNDRDRRTPLGRRAEESRDRRTLVPRTATNIEPGVTRRLSSTTPEASIGKSPRRSTCRRASASAPTITSSETRIRISVIVFQLHYGTGGAMVPAAGSGCRRGCSLELHTEAR